MSTGRHSRSAGSAPSKNGQKIGSKESAGAPDGRSGGGQKKPRKKPLSGRRWWKSERRSSLREVLLANSFALFYGVRMFQQATRFLKTPFFFNYREISQIISLCFFKFIFEIFILLDEFFNFIFLFLIRDNEFLVRCGWSFTLTH